MVPSVVWLQVLSAQNQHFGWFPSLFMDPSVVWLQCVVCSKSIFWVVPLTFHGSLCCLAPKCFPLKIDILGDLCPLFMVPSVAWLQSNSFLFCGYQCCKVLGYGK